MSGLSL